MNTDKVFSELKKYVDEVGFINILMEHQLEVMYYSMMKTEVSEKDLSSELKMIAIKRAFMNNMLYDSSIRTINLIKDSGVEYCLFKGPMLARYYDQVNARYMCDLDVLIPPKDRERLVKFFESKGYRLDTHERPDKEFKLVKTNEITIEVHLELFNHDEISEADELTSFFWDNRVADRIDYIDVWTLDPESHFRYCILHLLVHFKNAGVGFKQMIDVAYLIEVNKIVVKDHIAFFESLGYNEFYLALMRFIRYFFLYDTYNGGVSKEIDHARFSIDEMFSYIVESGSYGSDDNFNAAMYHKHIAADSGKKRFLRFFEFVWPSKEKLDSSRYDYIRKRPILLPVARIHRVFYLIFTRNISSKKKKFIFTSKDKFASRRKLFEQMGLYK